MPPGKDENAEGKSTISVAVDAKCVLAMADSVPPNAETEASQTVPGRSKNARRESRRVAASKKKATHIQDERTLRQAMACIHTERWLEAMLDELTSLSEHGVFELSELPPGHKPVAGKWVLKIKRGVQSEIERFKARYVAKGFTQVHGVDFFEKWAPVGRYATLRMLLSVCAVEDVETKNIDIKCAFLNGGLEEEVYMVQPPMFNDGFGRLWRLKKALYGLKQAAREWHRALAKLLSVLGFERCASDSVLYVSEVGSWCFIFVWVDDLLFSAKDQLQPLVDKPLTTFEGRNMKEVSYVLGMEVIRDRSKRTVTITHRNMITELLSRFHMSDCKRSPTPLVPKEKILSLSEDPSMERGTVSEHKRFMQAVGSIQYIAVVTRPDLAFAADVLARHMAGSAKKHWLVVQHVIRYLQSTIDVGLTFNGLGNEDVVDVFSDADFANIVSMKSVSGMVARMYGNCVFWQSKRQEIIAWDMIG